MALDSNLRRTNDYKPALAWFAAFGTVWVFVLVILGAFTTSIGAGMVFSDWPLSNGSLNPPGWMNDLAMFADMAKAPKFSSEADVPFSILLPAFVTSELKTAFQIGFMLFLPFLVIDLVVASVLMSLGMMMMSPVTVSAPIKLILFVVMDGWSMISQGLVRQYIDVPV